MDPQPYSILIVDDSDEDRVTYRRYLAGARKGAYIIRDAQTGRQGLDICKAEAVDCVLLDYNLPDMDGMEFLAELQHSLDAHAPAVIVLTGQGNERIAADAIKSGAQDYLVKGLASTEVTSAVQNAIENVVLRQRVAAQDRALRTQAEALARADRRKDEFIAALAHELRNPLSPIRFSMEILRRQFPDTPAIVKASAVVNRQVDHLTRLLDDLLDVARITGGKLVLQRKDVTLSEVIARVCDQSAPLMEKYGHTLRIEQPQDPFVLNADPVRLVQTVVNIVTNACKFSPIAGVIGLTVQVLGHEACFTITDTGIGLEKDSLQRIFEMFSQACAPSLNLGGLGVGLSLAKQFAEMHGGTVQAESDGLGLGCRFIVRLPVVRAAGSAEAPSGEAGHAAGHQASGKHILVVDDNRDSADSLKALLESEGYSVVAAYDGLEAIARAAERPPDVILMDLGMPGINGYEAARKIRRDHGSKPMLIVAVTGWGDRETRQRALDAGFDHHLLKPIDLSVARDLIGL